MPNYKVTIGSVIVKADNEKDAKVGACMYVGSDLGIECLDVEVVNQKEYDYEV